MKSHVVVLLIAVGAQSLWRPSGASARTLERYERKYYTSLRGAHHLAPRRRICPDRLGDGGKSSREGPNPTRGGRADFMPWLNPSVGKFNALCESAEGLQKLVHFTCIYDTTGQPSLTLPAELDANGFADRLPHRCPAFRGSSALPCWHGLAACRGVHDDPLAL
jgi:hypothetical protein